MRTRKAILPDAQLIHELIAGYSGDGTLLAAHLAGDLRERSRLCRSRRRRPDHWLRRAAPVRHASGGNSVDYGRSVGARQRRRRAPGESPAGGGEAPSRGLHLPVHAQAGFLRGTRILGCTARGSSRQDLQRLPRLSDGFIAAMKWRWCAEICRSSRFFRNLRTGWSSCKGGRRARKLRRALAKLPGSVFRGAQVDLGGDSSLSR